MVPTAWQDEALARDGVSRQVPSSALKGGKYSSLIPSKHQTEEFSARLHSGSARAQSSTGSKGRWVIGKPLVSATLVNQNYILEMWSHQQASISLCPLFFLL